MAPDDSWNQKFLDYEIETYNYMIMTRIYM